MVTTELAVQQPAEVARQNQPQDIMQIIAQAVMSGTTSVEVVKELHAIRKDILRWDAEVEFNAALARLMPQLPRIHKGGVILNKDKSPRSRYATYEEIDSAIRPFLADEGFSFSFDTDSSVAGRLITITTLSHRLGHSRSVRSGPLPIENPVITGCQAVGSAMSYGMRYGVCRMLNIVCEGEDNDGQGDPQSIGAEQVLTLETLLQDSKADRAKFLAWARVGKLEDIQEKDYAAALDALTKALKAFQARTRNA